MSLHDKKKIVLGALKRESRPMALSEIMQCLGKEFKERSVRRWLNLLVEEGVIQKIGEKRGSKYVAVNRPEPIDEPPNKLFSDASLESIAIIKRPLFERQPIAYQESWLDQYQPNNTFFLKARLREQLFKAGSRKSSEAPAGTYAHRIFNRLMIDLSYNSSRLEGNTYSLLDTERLLLTGWAAQSKLDEEKVMILNHKEAIRYLVDGASRLALSRNVVCTLHFLLSDGLLPTEEAGKIRKSGVRIGGSTYIPLEDWAKLGRQLDKIATKAAMIRDPFEQSLFLLIHISYLQAFIDVNKRTARLSANVPLIKENLVPLAFKDLPIDDYMSAMIAIYELQVVQPVVDLYVFSYLRTCAAYDATVESVGFDEVRVTYRKVRRGTIREIILQRLSGQAIMDFVVAEAHLQIPPDHQADFIEDALEDLENIDESRLIGLGVSPQELAHWQQGQIEGSNQ